ncbi:MAG: dihydrofolate reductase family protein [Spirochaetota bacterium]
MKEVILYIATSLDSYIATKDGSVDWLFSEGEYGYDEFYETIGTTLIGYNTYKEILGFGKFPYTDKTNYIFSMSHTKNDNNPVHFIAKDPVEFTANLKKEPGKDIWLVGGGQINTLLLNAGLIDRMILFIHPIILGDGIPLLGGMPKKSDFSLKQAKTFVNGVVEVEYEKK